MSEEITRKDAEQAVTDITKQSSYTWLPLVPTVDELDWERERSGFMSKVLNAFALSPEEIGTISDANITASSGYLFTHSLFTERKKQGS